MSRDVGGFVVLFNALALIQGCLVLFAGSFLAAAIEDGNTMMPEIYGKAAVEYPATWWASWFFIGHLMGAVGLWSSRHKLAIAGVSLITPAYLLLAVFSVPATFGSIITLHSMLVGAPLQILTVCLILIYGVRRNE